MPERDSVISHGRSVEIVAPGQIPGLGIAEGNIMRGAFQPGHLGDSPAGTVPQPHQFIIVGITPCPDGKTRFYAVGPPVVFAGRTAIPIETMSGEVINW